MASLLPNQNLQVPGTVVMQPETMTRFPRRCTMSFSPPTVLRWDHRNLTPPVTTASCTPYLDTSPKRAAKYRKDHASNHISPCRKPEALSKFWQDAAGRIQPILHATPCQPRPEEKVPEVCRSIGESKPATWGLRSGSFVNVRPRSSVDKLPRQQPKQAVPSVLPDCIRQIADSRWR